jgi:hypothetical protein
MTDAGNPAIGAPCGGAVSPGRGGGGGGSIFPPPQGDGPAWFIQPCAVMFSGVAAGFFDTQPTGVAVGTTVPSSLAVANTSKKTPLVINAISVEGPNAADFTVDAAAVSRAMASPLPPNKSQNGLSLALPVAFTAGAEGPRTASLRIVSDAGTALVPLAGKGLPTRPLATLGPPPVMIAFPPLAASTAPGRVVLENAGGKPLTIQGLRFDGPDAGASQRAPVNKGIGNCSSAGGDQLLPLGFCSIGIEVVPGNAGPKTAVYLIETDDPVTPTISVPLTLSP